MLELYCKKILRKDFFRSAAWCLALCSVALLCAQCSDSSRASESADTEPIQYLFVITGDGGTLEGDQLTMENPSKATVYFSDRPFRKTGHILTEKFIVDWVQGVDSFENDPPNAAFSTQEENPDIAVMEILEQPVLDGDSLTMRIGILEGDIPEDFNGASLFIDSSGSAGRNCKEEFVWVGRTVQVKYICD